MRKADVERTDVLPAVAMTVEHRDSPLNERENTSAAFAFGESRVPAGRVSSQYLSWFAAVAAGIAMLSLGMRTRMLASPSS